MAQGGTLPTESKEPATSAVPDEQRSAMMPGLGENTAIADYVWLPIRFDGEYPAIEWLEELRVEDHE